MLAADKPPNRQLFIATHSGDVLRGFLDVEPKALRVVRIRRDMERNWIAFLDPGSLRAVWGDPVLRFSNILDGVFHERVVVCEGDADCRFYAAVLDATMREDSTVRQPDLMFASSGGKHRMPTVVTALRGLDVPACVVADFDVLKEEDLLRRIFHGLAVLGRPIEADWKLVKDTLERRCPPLTTAQVRQQLTAILDGVKTIAFPEDAAERIRKEMRTVSAWAQVKSAGLQGLPSGQPTEVARRLLRTLRARGLFVVECGELERFVPSVGGHGPSWVVSALEKDLKNDRELETARRFVTDVARFNPSAEPLA